MALSASKDIFLMTLLIALKLFIGLLLVCQMLSEHMLQIFQSNIISHKFYDGYCCCYESLEMFHKSILIRSCWIAKQLENNSWVLAGLKFNKYILKLVRDSGNTVFPSLFSKQNLGQSEVLFNPSKAE